MTEKKPMKVMKAIGFLSVLVIAAMIAQDASAYLSSYSSSLNNNDWQGYNTYEETGLSCTLIFNVYDNIAYHNEVTAWAGDVDFPAGDRYVYAYQLFVDQSSTKEVTFFSILQASGDAINNSLMHVTQAILGSGAMTDPNPSDEDEQGKWTWSEPVGLLSAGDYSAYLVFSSPYAPVRGSFKVDTSVKEPPPGPELPEPATIAFLCLASGFLVARRNRKRRTA
jgi:hypothetical protein